MDKDNQKKMIFVQKDLSQPQIGYYGNVLIGSSRNFTVTEERYLMLLVAKASEQISKYKKLYGNRYKPEESICPKYVYFSPKVLLTEGSKKYKEVREAAEKFAQKTITAELTNDNGKKITRIVHLAGPIDISVDDIGTSYIKLRIEEELWELILDMTKGFSYLDIRYLFRLSKPEAMRLLPIFFNSSLFKKNTQNTNDLSYNLNTLKHMFGLDKSYKTKSGADDYVNFVKKVIQPALDEIRESGCPFYADYELIPGNKKEGQRGRVPINKIRFIPRRNLTVFQSVYPCLLPDHSPIRSPKVLQLLEQKYHFGSDIPKQVENVVCFAQKFISNDEDLWNVLYDIHPSVRQYGKGIEAGLIDQIKRYIKKKYEVDYVAPSKLKAEKKRIAKEGRTYTDWELVSLPDLEADLSPADIERLKALTEAQGILGKSEFQDVVDCADKLQKEQNKLDDSDAKFIYGIDHLTDKQLFDNAKAGIIDDANIEKYDEDSHNRLEFIVGLMVDCNVNHTAEFTWEYVQAQMKEKYYSNDSPALSVDDYNKMMEEHDEWASAGGNIALHDDSGQIKDLF